jgi:choline dehydrogenase-like flavoprotein
MGIATPRGQARPIAILVISMPLMEVGSSTENPTLTKTVQNSVGSGREWWEAEQIHWGRISLRFGPNDFKHKSVDGLGDDWPISYEDVAPYYDKIDDLIGVFGSKENIYNEPDGRFLPPPKTRLHEMFIMEGAKKIKIPVIPSRLSILTKKINDARGQCFYCSQCNRGLYGTRRFLVVICIGKASH